MRARQALTAGTRAQVLRFGLTSLLSAVITLGLPVVLHEARHIEPRVAVGIALMIAFGVNFLTTRYFVFRSDAGLWRALQRFALSSLAFRSAEYVGFLLLFEAGLPYFGAQLIVVGASFVLKFLTLRNFVFKGPAGGPA